VGSDVYVQVMVPDANIDTSKPSAVSRIELYAVTSMTPPARARFLEIATLVAMIPVAPAGQPGDPVVPAYDPAAGARQGASVTIRDALTTEAMTPRQLPLTVDERSRVIPPAAAAPPVAAPAPVNVLRRFYMAFAYGTRNRPGPPSAVAELPLSVLPVRPADVQLAMTEVAIALEWEPSAGLLGWLLNRSLPDETPPASVELRAPTAAPLPPPTDWLPGPTSYNVYREASPDPLALPDGPAAGRPWQVPLPSPLNPMPLTALRFDDPVRFDDLERCYYVRALRNGIESDPSPRRCLRAIDVFPPAAPTNLATITADGTITLLWNDNEEEDLGGYLVLRREAGGATLHQLTPRPVAQARYADRTVKPGVRYTYQVRAVDSRIPLPNVSDPVEVSETAR
jgi:hypothetical protein